MVFWIARMMQSQTQAQLCIDSLSFMLLLSRYLEKLLILGSSSCNHMCTTQLQKQSQGASGDGYTCWMSEQSSQKSLEVLSVQAQIRKLGLQNQ